MEYSIHLAGRSALAGWQPASAENTSIGMATGGPRRTPRWRKLSPEGEGTSKLT
eukprot:CAMPEP_0179918490 /NCGR_PEP_ID=MMETSP0983-20121128/3419_1 /TAXON_ID=483367 /ORGANISM="non described non described, Strain CCMP 2436" /LENGTH=53 /DNA_ID=CAMNT_0021821345 /DNA_START=161 /DNA_END=318 /DNA_ORIENTATION=+